MSDEDKLDNENAEASASEGITPESDGAPVEDSAPEAVAEIAEAEGDAPTDVQDESADDAAAESSDEVASSEADADEDDVEEEGGNPDAQPVSLGDEEDEEPEPTADDKQWYILKVQVNRESSICDALQRRVKMEGLEDYFGEILVPTEDVREFTKSGKQRIVKRKLYPGYIVVHMSINDDTWFLVRETPGIGDFTGAVGKPAPLNETEIGRIKQMAKIGEETAKEDPGIKTAIKFRPGDRVRVKEGYFQNFEGDVETVDESNGRITVMISIFGRATPVELDHWQVEDV